MYFSFAFGVIFSWSNISELSKQEIGNSGLYTNIDYNKLKTDYENLETDFDILSNQVSTLVEEQNKLQFELTIVFEKYLEEQKLLFVEEEKTEFERFKTQIDRYED